MPSDQNTSLPTNDPVGNAFVQFQQGKIQEAESLLQSVLVDEPNHPDALYGLGIIYFETERFADSAQYLARLDAAQPGSKDLLLRLASAYALADQPSKAVDTYKKLLTIAPHTPNIHFNLGVMLSDLHRWEEASSAFELAIEQEPGSSETLLNLADTYDRQARFEEAITVWQRAIALTGTVAQDPELHVLIGKRLRLVDRFEDSVHFFKRALDIVPNDTDVLFEQHRSMVLNKDLSGAHDCLEKVEALSPNYEYLAPAWAAVQLGLGRAEDALTTCEKHLQQYPHDITMLSTRPFILNDLGSEREQAAIYENYVYIKELSAADGFDTINTFNDALSEHILSHPSLRNSPPRTTTKNGQQTGELLVEPKGPVASLEHMLWETLDEYRANLSLVAGSANEPCNEWPKLKGITAWGVVLNAQGHQVPHLHPTGWISGVYYVDVPDFVSSTDKDHLGWLEFGAAPPEIPASKQPATFLIEPKPGRLVLFPSYFFHRTIPYTDTARRISIAFDFNPAL